MKKHIIGVVVLARLDITFLQAHLLQKINNAGTLFHVLDFGLLVLVALSVMFFALQGGWVALILTLCVCVRLTPFYDSLIHKFNLKTTFIKKYHNLFCLHYWSLSYAFFRASLLKNHVYKQISDDGIIPTLFTKRELSKSFLSFEPMIFLRSGVHLFSLELIIFLCDPKFIPWQEHVLQTSQSKIVHKIYQRVYLTLLLHLAIIITAIIFWLFPLLTTLAAFYSTHSDHMHIDTPQHNEMACNEHCFSKVCRSNKLDLYIYFHMNRYINHYVFYPTLCYRLRSLEQLLKTSILNVSLFCKMVAQIFKLNKSLE